jgi:hypothetical protein
MNYELANILRGNVRCFAARSVLYKLQKYEEARKDERIKSIKGMGVRNKKAKEC